MLLNPYLRPKWYLIVFINSLKASEMMLSDLNGKNMTVVEWLRVAGDD